MHPDDEPKTINLSLAVLAKEISELRQLVFQVTNPPAYKPTMGEPKGSQIDILQAMVDECIRDIKDLRSHFQAEVLNKLV